MPQEDTIEVGQLWEELNIPIKQSIHARVQHKEDAEDIHSETFIKVVDAFRRNKAPENQHHLRNWTRKIAINMCSDWYRRLKTKKVQAYAMSLPDEYEDEAGQSQFAQYQASSKVLIDYDSDPALEYERRTKSEAILRAWGELNSDDRMILGAVYMETPRIELCEKLCITKSGVSMRITRAAKRFQQNLEKEGISLPGDTPQGLPSLVLG
jgi:RNA polymerase sigma factor (sigma-70 family)